MLHIWIMLYLRNNIDHKLALRKLCSIFYWWDRSFLGNYSPHLGISQPLLLKVMWKPHKFRKIWDLDLFLFNFSKTLVLLRLTTRLVKKKLILLNSETSLSLLFLKLSDPKMTYLIINELHQSLWYVYQIIKMLTLKKELHNGTHPLYMNWWNLKEIEVHTILDS